MNNDIVNQLQKPKKQNLNISSTQDLDLNISEMQFQANSQLDTKETKMDERIPTDHSQPNINVKVGNLDNVILNERSDQASKSSLIKV